MDIVRTVADLRTRVRAWRGAGETVGLVPTMGGIHDGHLALVRAACDRLDHTVATLFVNPKQFGPGEDFGSYPRDEEGDSGRLEAEGVVSEANHVGKREVLARDFEDDGIG